MSSAIWCGQGKLAREELIISFGTIVMNENEWGLSMEGRTLDRMCKSQIENLQNT